jgi:hypothetical protein
MELKLIRETFTEKSTIGSLYVNGIFFCYTLEDKDRRLESGGVKEYAKTAIPRGKYKVINSFSNRFKKYLPELINVPQFAGIRIHAGNTADHSEGCILVGATKTVDFIGQSQVTFGKLMKAIQAVEKIEKINITIE